MDDLFSFEKMITPKIIMVFYVLGIIGSVLGGLYIMVEVNFFLGIAMMIFYPLGIRVYSELLIIIFRIYETLADIRSLLQVQQYDKPKRDM